MSAGSYTRTKIAPPKGIPESNVRSQLYQVHREGDSVCRARELTLGDERVVNVPATPEGYAYLWALSQEKQPSKVLATDHDVLAFWTPRSQEWIDYMSHHNPFWGEGTEISHNNVRDRAKGAL